MNSTEVCDRIASRFGSKFLRRYARMKLARDPLYAAVADRLRGQQHALIDIGCGIGLMEFYLREVGFAPPVTGVDHDASKISQAQRIGSSYANLDFATNDARSAMRNGCSVLMLDVLHYLETDEQKVLLVEAADAVPEGGVVIVRDAVRDESWRYRMTYLQEAIARAVLWLKAERLNFPRRDLVVEPFLTRGFHIEVTPLWGRTPFNNYLFVFRRPGSGTTKT